MVESPQFELLELLASHGSQFSGFTSSEDSTTSTKFSWFPSGTLLVNALLGRRWSLTGRCH